MLPLKQFFDANKQSSGAWIDNTCGYQTGCWIVQWHESAIYWTLWYQYTQWSGDTQYLYWMESNMAASVGGHGDFLGGYGRYEAESTRWNDDISWWAIAAADGAVALGKDAILTGDGHTYLSLASTTFDEVWDHWDTACNGGIYWGRDRHSTSNQVAFLKSTITNAQLMEIAAKIVLLTGDAGYKTKFDQIYAWITSVIMTADYYVADGVDSRYCAPMPQIYSYHLGVLLTAHVTMYKATSDPHYLTEATNLYNSILRQFVSYNVISIEPSCDATGACKTPNGFWWSLYKGLSAFYSAASDLSLKSSIATVLRASALKNIQLCNAQWYCMRYLPNGDFKLPDGTNVRDQFETVALLNALAFITLDGADAIPFNPDYQMISPTPATTSWNVSAAMWSQTSYWETGATKTAATGTARATRQAGSAATSMLATSVTASTVSGALSNDTATEAEAIAPGRVVGAVIGVLAALAIIGAAMFRWLRKGNAEDKGVAMDVPAPEAESPFLTLDSTN
ncbi:glycosyl hydrolase family 76-domain-containing protein [Chytriomyces sp. MP71]|nr:glycosyl hydrolase family 76-domain-containing protein [Chytriomyces sp. MP71]